jgi:hypothetical protein
MIKDHTFGGLVKPREIPRLSDASIKVSRQTDGIRSTNEAGGEVPRSDYAPARKGE